jgi:hypothetical protein
MRSEIPPPGPSMMFDAWSRAIVDDVRAYLPDARAARKGPRLVVIRHGDRQAQLVDDGGAFVISFRDGDAKTTTSLVDRDRRDAPHDVDVGALEWRDTSMRGLRARKRSKHRYADFSQI